MVHDMMTSGWPAAHPAPKGSILYTFGGLISDPSMITGQAPQVVVCCCSCLSDSLTHWCDHLEPPSPAEGVEGQGPLEGGERIGGAKVEIRNSGGAVVAEMSVPSFGASVDLIPGD